ncbi:hypothetical protein ACFY36_50645 [Actinoplanes sp. NPDC000266]
MGCAHNEFPTLTPTTIDDFADTFDTATLETMHRQAQHLAAGTSSTAAAWTKVAVTLAEAHHQRVHDPFYR